MNPVGNISLTKPQLIIIGAVLAVILFIVLGVSGVIPLFTQEEGDPNLPGAASLTVWGMSEDAAGFQELITAYKASSPQVQNYQVKFESFNSADELERRLVNALAEGTGPDVFYFHNSWAAKHAGKVQAAYGQLVTPKMVQDYFPQAVVDDFIARSGDAAYVIALPLHMDALVLLYNRDILESSGVVLEQKTVENMSWSDAIEISQQAKIINGGQLSRGGLAFGTTKNLPHAAEIVLSLLMQAGLPKTDANGKITLTADAQNPIEFYMQFASQGNPNYSWDDSFGSARDEFARGRAVLVADYLSAIPELKEKNSFLNIGVAPLPQLSASATLKRTNASYWGLAVSRTSQQKYASWHFARFATMQREAAEKFLDKTQKFPALTSLIKARSEGEFGPAIKSFLFARAFKSADPEAFNNALLQIITDVRINKKEIRQAITSAEQSIQR